MIESISAVAAETAKATVSATKEALAESLKESAETTVKESPVQSMMETIENSSLETLKARNLATINSDLNGKCLKARNLATINSDLKGKRHPETGVPFIEVTVEDIDGNQIIGVFPDFSEYTVFEVNLPENLFQGTDKIQSDYCNEKLKESYEKGNINTKNFTERQLQQIKNGDKPEGFTWHHNEVKGRMELVRSDIHQATAHTGGKSVWGGGNAAR